VAIEVMAGHVPSQPFLILGSQPLSGIHTFAAHTIYHHAEERSGQTFYVRGYAVPVALLVAPAEDVDLFGSADLLEEPLLARMGESGGEKIGKKPKSDPGVLLACLPSLDRLRGHASTRWYAPSSCPSWHR
jgi:hypothetical protein